ncbi:hypothetical protein AWC38_SpisGene17805 [Stylophora pistillata]|uniref:HECT domain-containing protein n=1 Tax=Stylophora pistillata TaxID=50429 RepID=A0A2B4RM15_STYPI|nr:hypothetical protein AWC38_SpisGene17805 [Stylophora pistillata]
MIIYRPPRPRPNASNVNAFVNIVFRSASSMINASSSNAVFRRLNSSERLRSLPTAKYKHEPGPHPGNISKPRAQEQSTVLQLFKKMAGQGVLYIRIKPGFEFLYEEDDDSSLEVSYLEKAEENRNHTVSDSPVLSVVNTFRSGEGDDKQPSQERSGELNTLALSDPRYAGDLPDKDPDELLGEIEKHSLSDPVEILKCLQQQVIKGRPLDIVDSGNLPEGETNYITVDRSNILTTTFAEFESINDFCKRFEADFMGEEARDLGGPRKEWIRLLNHAMKEKNFANGLREFLSDEYFFVGVMMGVALL